jgi:hypothetical protein
MGLIASRLDPEDSDGELTFCHLQFLRCDDTLLQQRLPQDKVRRRRDDQMRSLLLFSLAGLRD